MTTATKRSLIASLVARANPVALGCLLLFAMLAAGCKPSTTHTSDSRIKQIDQLINQQLPPGTPMSHVIFFLNSRGYPAEPADGGHSIVATIEHVDTETLRPSAARVTFHFDSSNKLLTYDMTPAEPSGVQR